MIEEGPGPGFSDPGESLLMAIIAVTPMLSKSIGISFRLNAWFV